MVDKLSHICIFNLHIYLNSEALLLYPFYRFENIENFSIFYEWAVKGEPDQKVSLFMNVIGFPE